MSDLALLLPDCRLLSQFVRPLVSKKTDKRIIFVSLLPIQKLINVCVDPNDNPEPELIDFLLTWMLQFEFLFSQLTLRKCVSMKIYVEYKLTLI